MDDSDPTFNGTNLGLLSRYMFTKDGAEVELEGTLCTDIGMQDKLLINGVKVVYKLYPQQQRFALMSPDENLPYEYQVTEAVLRVCKVTPTNDFISAQNKVLMKHNAIYPYTKSVLKTFDASIKTCLFGGVQWVSD